MAQIVAAVAGSQVFDRAPVDTGTHCTGSLDVFVGKIVCAIARLGDEGEHFIEAEQVGDVCLLRCRTQLEQLVSLCLGR